MLTEQDLVAVENTLQLAFHDRTLLAQALVHRSYLNENPESHLISNERLEFLGDAVLDFLTAEFLYLQHTQKKEGELTQLRSALVCTETLANLATQLNLGQHLIMSRGEESDGGRNRPTTLANTFEALLGAIYLDKGIEQVREFLLPLLEQEVERWHGRPPVDAKSALQIQVQGATGFTPRYRTVDAWGPDHARHFLVEVMVGNRVLGRGEGPSKQAAQQEAAHDALEKMLWEKV